MKRKNKCRLAYSLNAALVTWLLVLSVSVGCGCSANHAVTVKRGIGHFSFQYPPSYVVMSVDVRDDKEHTYTNVVLFRHEIEQEGATARIQLIVDEANEYEPNIKAAVEQYLSLVSKFPDFKLLEVPSMLTVTSGNIPAQQFVFSYSIATRLEPGSKTISEISRVILFEQGGLIWKFVLVTGAANFTADEADLDYILQTFKILD